MKREIEGLGQCDRCGKIQPIYKLDLFSNYDSQNCIDDRCQGHVKELDDSLPF